MAVEVETKDCTALTDGEIAEMADICAEGPMPYEVGLFSKQAEAWVLVTTVRLNGKLKGFMFSTLERVGGTPAVLLALGGVERNSRRDTVLRALMGEVLYKALMAFPDEDVVVGGQFAEAGALAAFRSVGPIIPRPDYDANGEDRQWGRRLAKRFGIPDSRYEHRVFRVNGTGDLALIVDHTPLKPEFAAADVAEQFVGLDAQAGDALIMFAWAMAEDLEKLR